MNDYFALTHILKTVLTIICALSAYNGEVQAKQLDNSCVISPKIAYQTIMAEKVKVQQIKNNQYLNINTASVAEFTELPNIGVKKAQAIVDYRLQHGLFNHIDDITKVKGIGKKTLAKFADKIVVYE